MTWSGQFVRPAKISIGAVLLMALATAAQAIPISITNAGFEDPVLLDGGIFGPTPPGWTVLADCCGPTGVFNATVSSFFDEAPEGENTAFTNGTSLSQTLASALAANTTYTLQVEVGNPANVFGFNGYVIELFAGSILLVDDGTSAAPNKGLFSTATILFMTDADPLGLGQNLEIRLSGKVGGGLLTQVHFDDVRLNASTIGSVPEPTTLTIFTLGLLGLGVARRWKVIQGIGDVRALSPWRRRA